MKDKRASYRQALHIQDHIEAAETHLNLAKSMVKEWIEHEHLSTRKCDDKTDNK